MKLLLFALLAGTSGAGAQNQYLIGPLAPFLKSWAQSALANEESLAGADITVEANGSGVITLTGTTASAGQIARAEAVIHRKLRDVSVCNLLYVRTARLQKKAAGFGVRGSLLVRHETVVFERGVPARFKRAGEFLRQLSASAARSEGDGGRKTAFSARDVERLVGFVSPRGLSIEDARENKGKARFLSKSQLRRDLKRTGSSAFDSFAFAGQDIRLQVGAPISSRVTRNGVAIAMPSGLGFTWEREGAARGLFLRKLKYLPGPT